MVKKRIHFIGIGGIGVSGIARYFKLHGYAISGSDTARNSLTDALRKENVKIFIGHKRSNINTKIDAVVYSRAIPSDNVEIVTARNLGIPVIPYATVLGQLTERLMTIAITGSHGKSTTTALTGLALTRAGLDPTVLVGTNLREFGGKNIRNGRSRYLVLEADDYAAAFLAYSPAILIITNIDREHMDFYKTFVRVKAAFLKFIECTRDRGVLILNRDDGPLYSLRPQITRIAKRKKLWVIWYSIKTPAGHRLAARIKKILKLPGEHNLSNAMAVYELGEILRLDKKKMLGALGAYNGSWRRMEYRGTAQAIGKSFVYDDYAHHPTEIRVTLQAFHEKFPHQPIVCVFQPHQAKRLKLLFNDFVSAFDRADVLVLIPAYTVAGRDKSASKFTSERLATAIAKKYPHKKIFYVAHPGKLKHALKQIIPARSVIVMMGAGDIIQYTDLLL